ncbi:MAG: hypothetical protein ABJH06_09965 [Paraglaciecola sp.]|uniref:hypothetical protein n=1 Tax=Paraglaciecola sp. TaxID=1920173 RepID=UPI0032971D79
MILNKINVDVFAPCGMSGTLNESSITALKVKVVAGAANNQLAKENYGELLRSETILYALDFVINTCGIIEIHHQGIASSIERLKFHIENREST